MTGAYRWLGQLPWVVQVVNQGREQSQLRIAGGGGQACGLAHGDERRHVWWGCRRASVRHHLVACGGQGTPEGGQRRDHRGQRRGGVVPGGQEGERLAKALLMGCTALRETCLILGKD